MTKEQIEAMEPGPEMNRAVAELVMKWEVASDDPLLSAFNGHTYFSNGFRHWWADDDGPSRALFSPSTDIAAAFEVVEKMCTDFYWQFTLHIEAPCIASARFFQKNSAPHNPEPFARNSVGKLPLSICRAALLAVAEDNNG